jgi:magnesium-protoporphyrin IX monomethyl ester (oxidative) cyclase
VVVKSPQKVKEKEETHFVQNPEFKAATEKLQGPLWQIFVEFLECSCTAEFSDFLL